VLVNSLQDQPNPGDFVLLLILLDVQLIPSGTGFPLPIYYIIAVLMKSLGRTEKQRVLGPADGLGLLA
jgi:hypothetical protein